MFHWLLFLHYPLLFSYFILLHIYFSLSYSSILFFAVLLMGTQCSFSFQSLSSAVGYALHRTNITRMKLCCMCVPVLKCFSLWYFFLLWQMTFGQRYSNINGKSRGGHTPNLEEFLRRSETTATAILKRWSLPSDDDRVERERGYSLFHSLSAVLQFTFSVPFLHRQQSIQSVGSNSGQQQGLCGQPVCLAGKCRPPLITPVCSFMAMLTYSDSGHPRTRAY